MSVLSEITSPALLLDKEKCIANIEGMIAKAKKHHLILRPHFKTHQSVEVGTWFKERGINSCTVSSLQMAEKFANAGWDDITIAFPFNPRETKRLIDLSSRIQLNILIVSETGLEHLAASLGNRIGVFIKVDTGYGRTGIPASSIEELEKLLSTLDKYAHLDFKGILSHAGHSYKCRSSEEVLKVHQENVFQLRQLRSFIKLKGFNCFLSTGDTPTCSIAKDWREIDEMRPGVFVFYDLMMEQIGACSEEEIAVCMACPVVAKYPGRNEVIVHGGGVHFSKDFLLVNGEKQFGRIVSLDENGKWTRKWEGAFVSKLSQEHGIITVSQEQMNKIAVGDLLGVLPVHACLTSDCMSQDYKFV